MAEAWDWLARNIAEMRHGISDPDTLTEGQWRACVDLAFAWMAQNNAPAFIATSAVKLRAAQRQYRAALDAHRAAEPDDFIPTLEAWKAAGKNLDAVEAATAYRP